MEWSVKKISAFLRAYDYGMYHVLGTPYLMYEGVTYEWKGYKLFPSDRKEKAVYFEGDHLMISDEDMKIKLIQMTPCVASK